MNAKPTNVRAGSTLLNAVAAATSVRDRETLDYAIAALLVQFLGAHSVSLIRLTTEVHIKEIVREVTLSSRDGSPVVFRPPEPSAWQRCVDHGAVVQCDGEDDRVVTLIPIRGEREVVGVLAVEASDGLMPRDADLVHGILQIAKNHLSLLDYGELDTLTGLLNRKTLESRFEKLRQRLVTSVTSADGGEPSWLALIDIDKFKSINDSYGHLFGDEVLLLISQHIRRSFRGADLLFRYGGEEFLVMLDQASDTGAHTVLERLRASIEAHEFPQVGRVTISVGYTRIDAGDTATNGVERADAALYYAKGHGRNKVHRYESLVEAGELAAKRTRNDVELF